MNIYIVTRRHVNFEFIIILMLYFCDTLVYISTSISIIRVEHKCITRSRGISYW